MMKPQSLEGKCHTDLRQISEIDVSRFEKHISGTSAECQACEAVRMCSNFLMTTSVILKIVRHPYFHPNTYRAPIVSILQKEIEDEGSGNYDQRGAVLQSGE